MSAHRYPQFDNDNPFVIITSDEPWCDVWHTQLHYAHHLSKMMNVVFIDPPSPWGLLNILYPRKSAKRISDSLLVVKYLNVIPSFLGNFSVWLNDRITQAFVANITRGLSRTNPSVVWHFDRYRSVYLYKQAKFVKHLYHVIDPVANLNYDEYLAVNSDLVISVSSRYMSHYLKLNPKTVHFGQGYDGGSHSEKNVGFNTNYQGSIVLLGSFLNDVDYELLIRIANTFPNRKLVLIGPDKTSMNDRADLFKELCGLSNVEWTGPLPPEKHLPILRSSSVCLIAYDTSGKVLKKDRIFGTPLKVISYLACHKPVVTNIDCEIPSLVGKAIYYASDADSYLDFIQSLLENEIVLDSSKLDAYLESISYEKIIGNVFERLQIQIPSRQ